MRRSASSRNSGARWATLSGWYCATSARNAFRASPRGVPGAEPEHLPRVRSERLGSAGAGRGRLVLDRARGLRPTGPLGGIGRRNPGQHRGEPLLEEPAIRPRVAALLHHPEHPAAIEEQVPVRGGVGLGAVLGEERVGEVSERVAPHPLDAALVGDEHLIEHVPEVALEPGERLALLGRPHRLAVPDRGHEQRPRGPLDLLEQPRADVAIAEEQRRDHPVSARRDP